MLGVAPVPDSNDANAPYHLLGRLDRALWLAALVCSSGTTARRLDELSAWEQRLVAGELPDRALNFGDAQALHALRAAVADLDLCALTHGSPAMARQVLRALLWHLDTLMDRPPGQSRAQAITHMVQLFRDDWSTQRQGWEEVRALFRGLGDLAEQQWDSLRGQLRSREWQQALRIGELLQQLPDLTAFIDAVGRAQCLPQAPVAWQAQPAPQTLRRPRAMLQITHLADQPGEVRGVKRSGQIARMLASEAAMVRHPLLKRLWRARFAEQQLLTYEDEAVLTQWRWQADASHALASTKQAQPLARGPMLVCLDTSGSMRGAPENVAKACVLQALRSAHAMRRACRLLAFGGAGELVERDLSPTAAGLEALLEIMGQGFDGGTDVQTPLERATALAATPTYAQADILIVSDGEFGVTPATLQALRRCKAELGLRVHSILIGDRETIGMLEVSDQLFWVRAWRRYATASKDAYADGFSPVHSRSLTALYFPNAIRR